MKGREEVLSVLLAEKLEELPYKARKFLMFRVARVGCATALRLSNSSKGTYNSWFKNKRFARLYKQLPLLQRRYKPIIKDELEVLCELEQTLSKFNTARGCF